jgi:hypothetical protein
MIHKSTFVSNKLKAAGPTTFSAWCIVAAFGAYFCMYAFRKPFTAGTFEGDSLAGVSYKVVLVAAQVFGYTLSKFIGIKVVSEMRASRRALSILALIGVAEAALLLFAVTPAPYNFIWLFLNGLPLGMVFGLVLAFLEGRRVTEALSAGLCASFIVASGVVKSVGRSLVLDWNVSEYWMPFLTGLLFVGPLLFFVWMLNQIPVPSKEDVVHRSKRTPMNRLQRGQFFGRHAVGLIGLLSIYILLTVMRSIRDDFAVEIWGDLGESEEPSIYAKSETLVVFGVLVITGAAICIRNNRSAFLGSLVLIGCGFVLVLATLGAFSQGWLSPFAFMVLIGLGTYVPYVAFHTTVFERLIAAFRERGNIGYLMYLADATGYLAYVGVMVAKEAVTGDLQFLRLFLTTSLLIAVSSLVITLYLARYYWRRIPKEETTQLAVESN